MKIIADNREIEIELEDEKTVKDFLAALSGQWEAIGRSLIRIEINGKPYDESLNSLPITPDMSCRIETEATDALVEAALHELARLRDSVAAFYRTIGDLPLLFQSGKSAEAYHQLTLFTELLEQVNRILALLPIDGKADAFREMDLAPILRQLAEAFEADDAVLIGDLMEYEIAPKIEILLSFLDRVLKKG